MTIHRFTLHPVPYIVQDEEWWQAWRLHNQISRKTWIQVAAVVAISLALMILFWYLHYSTVLLWIVLLLTAAYVAFRRYGIEYLARRQMGDQLSKQPRDLLIGIQPQGLTFAQDMPVPQVAQPQRKTGKRKGMQQAATKLPKTTRQTALVRWDHFGSWRESDQLFVLYRQGTAAEFQVIPKRLDQPEFPVSSLRAMLQQHLGEQRP